MSWPADYYPASVVSDVLPGRKSSTLYNVLVGLNIFFVLTILLLTLYVLISKSSTSIFTVNIQLFSNKWSPENGVYGLLTPLLGSLLVSTLAIPIVLIFSIPLVIAIVEYARGPLSRILDVIVDLTAGLPTIIFAYIGLAFLSNWLKYWVEEPLNRLLNFIPLFSCKPLTGQNIGTAALILAISTVPFTTALIREAYKMIPHSMVEALYSVGLYKEEVAYMKISMIKTAIVSAILFSTSRVLTETTIVSLLAGNQFIISSCIFTPMITIPSLIVNNFGYSTIYPLLDSVLFTSALILYAISLALNFAGLYLNMKLEVIAGG